MFDKLEDTLKLILQKLEQQEELLQLSISALTTKKDVAKFLNKSTNTIDNYISNDTFLENIHYFYNENKKIEFIPLAILKFKKNPTRSTKKSITNLDEPSKKIYHSSINTLIKGLNIEH